jgi:hypothetical protein
MQKVLGGLAAAVVGTVLYALWNDVADRLIVHFHVFAFYLPAPYLALSALAPTDQADAIALADRICATLTALGLLAMWGWFVTVPITPQNAQAPIGLFMVGWTGAAGFYGTVKLVAYEIRRRRDRS